MTRDEAIELLRDLDGAIEDNHGRDYDEAFRMAIESLSAEPSGDLISREEAIKAVEQEYKIDRGYMADDYTYGFNQAIQYVSDIILHDLPSAEPNCKKCAIKELWKATEKEDLVKAVRCEDCRWYDNRYGEVCHNPRYGDGHANYSPPYVDEEYWCKDGERREP